MTSPLPELSRRELLGASVLAVTAFTLAPAASAQQAAVPPAFTTRGELKPLQFNPARLDGLSERLITSHWENNYGGSVRALAETQRRLAAAREDGGLPAYLYNEMKREHLLRANSVTLHELYFDNLGGNGQAPASERTRIGEAFGSYGAWENEFKRIGNGLGGGSGWVLLGFNQHTRTLENYWLADHAHGPAFTLPILVMDMYEHSYHIDYGASAAAYVDAFMRNINWDVVGERLGRALASGA